MMRNPGEATLDVEKKAGLGAHLGNSAVTKLSWKNVGVSSSSLSKNVQPTPIIANVDGIAKAGESCFREPSLSKRSLISG